jgi:hypothetical protein
MGKFQRHLREHLQWGKVVRVSSRRKMAAEATPALPRALNHKHLSDLLLLLHVNLRVVFTLGLLPPLSFSEGEMRGNLK